MRLRKSVFGKNPKIKFVRIYPLLALYLFEFRIYLPAMPSAAFRSLIFLTLVLLNATLPATAAPLNLVADDFSAATDSLWHFQAAAYRDGILSPGREADIPGIGPVTGQLKIDRDANSLCFTPRRLHNSFRSCFLAYRNDFRMDSVFASHVRVEIGDNLMDPSMEDSLGGLFLLIKYEGEYGYQGTARTATKVKAGQSIFLDTCAFISVNTGSWLTTQKIDAGPRASALAHITGVGLFYISGATGSAATQSLRLGGFRARGDLKWPRLEGKPANARMRAGDTLMLRWKFPPGLDAKFSWFRNERPVPDVQGPAYRFSPSLENAMTHVFRAEAKLENGDLVPTGEMRVQVVKPAAPVLRQQPGDTSVPEGGDVILKVKAEGMQPLTYQWFKNDKPISGAKQSAYTFVPSSIYESGQYHCEVTDRLGAATRSHKSTLIVKPGPGSEGWVPQALTVGGKAGVNLSDFYQDEAGLPPSQYQWSYLQAGLQAVWQFRPALALETDLLFVRKGFAREFSDHGNTLTLDYLECPLLLRLRLGKGMPKMPLYALLGGYGAFLIGAENEEDWGSWKGAGPASGYSDWDYGPSAGMVWQLGVLSLEWRYSLGAADLRGGEGNGSLMVGTLSGMVGFSLLSAQETAR